MIDERFIEAVLVLAAGAEASRVEAWLGRHGLAAQPMRAGLLATGDRASFERAFGVSLERAEPPVSLPVPAEVAGLVESATIPTPRRIP